VSLNGTQDKSKGLAMFKRMGPLLGQGTHVVRISGSVLSTVMIQGFLLGIEVIFECGGWLSALICLVKYKTRIGYRRRNIVLEFGSKQTIVKYYRHLFQIHFVERKTQFSTISKVFLLLLIFFRTYQLLL
jgi:hypothetical protein